MSGLHLFLRRSTLHLNNNLIHSTLTVHILYPFRTVKVEVPRLFDGVINILKNNMHILFLCIMKKNSKFKPYPGKRHCCCNSYFAIVVRMELLRNKEPRQLLLRFLKTGFGFESGVFWISNKQNFVSCTLLEIVNLKSVLVTQNQNLVRLGITYGRYLSLYFVTS